MAGATEKLVFKFYLIFIHLNSDLLLVAEVLESRPVPHLRPQAESGPLGDSGSERTGDRILVAAALVTDQSSKRPFTQATLTQRPLTGNWRCPQPRVT